MAIGKWIGLGVAIATPLIGGFAGGILTKKEIKGWYRRIKKPTWTPPNAVFPLAWTFLYISQGLASWLVWIRRDSKAVQLPLALYAVQLAMNFCWTPIFFTAHRPAAAAVESAATLGVAAAATVAMSKVAPASQILPLMVPYLGWMAFATALAGKIALDNPKAHLIDSSPAEEEKDEKKAN
mmetsp:Transcript_40757/g.121581  ORF Transcript_40757/g.121581 Transcript_40757/m.121581 type:complete len:181 (-) Transcript_40757:415-957(-)